MQWTGLVKPLHERRGWILLAFRDTLVRTMEQFGFCLSLEPHR